MGVEVWTVEQVETLRRLWAEGVSTIKIGQAVGVSKNAVIGKKNRLNLPSRPSPLNRPGPRKPEKVKRAGKVTLEQFPPTGGEGPAFNTHVAPSVPVGGSGQPYTKPGRLAAKMGPAVPERVESLFAPPSRIPNAAALVDPSLLGAAISRGMAGGMEQRAMDRVTPSRLATFKPRPQRGVCCWPMWGDKERPTQQFCDAPTEGGAYCPAHHAVGYRKVDANYLPSVGWL